jgi:hypothetical protein
MQGFIVSSAPPSAIDDCPKQQNDNDQEEEDIPEDESNQDEDKHILDEWAQLKLSLTKVTKIMVELSNDALTVQWGLSRKSHLAEIIEEVANHMHIYMH